MKRRPDALRIILCILILLTMILSFGACSKGSRTTPAKERDRASNLIPALGITTIEHDAKFGGVNIKISIDDFNALGFAFGDSLNIYFSNGFEVKGVPYYNGFYVDTGDPVLVGYPGYQYVRLTYNYGEDMYVKGGLTEKTTVTVQLESKGKYLNIQESMDIHYSDDQGDKSDAVFANFRAANVGNLKWNILYRSASPVDDQHNRAAVTDRLAAEAGIAYVIDLSDSDEDLAGLLSAEGFNSPYFRSLYDQKKYVALSMSSAYRNESFSKKLVEGLTAASGFDGPYLVHCVEGKDRTGFVCMVLEALAGAAYQEIVDDYMLTYDNYYGINETGDPTRYKTIKEKNIDEMLQYIAGFGQAEEVTTADLAHCANEYLLSIGMKADDLDALKAKLIRGMS